jgi:hypothetical protein
MPFFSFRGLAESENEEHDRHILSYVMFQGMVPVTSISRNSELNTGLTLL